MAENTTHAFTKRIKDVINHVAQTGRIKNLEFLNETELDVLEKMVKNDPDVHMIAEGGFTGATRKRAVLAPTYIPDDSLEPLVDLIKIEVIGTGTLTHSQILGSLMALNIDRNIIGDITVTEYGGLFASCEEFQSFLFEHFTKVGRHDVRLSVVHEEIEKDDKVETLNVIVSSMRLDVVVKALIHASRGKAEDYLDAGFVRRNHVVEKKVSRLCHVGDVLSIRKHGRFKLIDDTLTTKSGKIVLVVEVSV